MNVLNSSWQIDIKSKKINLFVVVCFFIHLFTQPSFLESRLCAQVPLRDLHLGGRDRSLIHTAGPRCWWRGEHQWGWGKPGLCLPTGPCSCLHCPAFCLCAQFQLIVFPSPNGLGAHFKHVRSSSEWSLSLTFTDSFGPRFQCPGGSLSVLCPSASRLSGLAYRGMRVPSLLCLLLAHLWPSGAAFQIFLLRPAFQALFLIPVICSPEVEDRALGTEEFIKIPVEHFGSLRRTSFLLCQL